MFRPVARAFNPRPLVHCHRNGRTNERHRSPKICRIHVRAVGKGVRLYGAYTVIATTSAYLMELVPY